MHEQYDYVTAHVKRDGLAAVRELLGGAAYEAVADAGGLLWGSWLGAGSIGWFDDEVVVAVAWPNARGDAGALVGAFTGFEDVAVERLEATARPPTAIALAAGGVCAHRWFELDDTAGFDELLTLSAEAWPAFEAAYDAAIEGFFHSIDDPRRVLLVTRYASVAEWERSRGVGQVQTGDLAESRRRFARRRQLTRRQIVRIAPLVALPRP